MSDKLEALVWSLFCAECRERAPASFMLQCCKSVSWAEAQLKEALATLPVCQAAFKTQLVHRLKRQLGPELLLEVHEHILNSLPPVCLMLCPCGTGRGA